jgi:predicted amidohydrolase YtcJ
MMARGHERYAWGVTHEYTILTGGIVVCGGSAPDATAIAWAADTILAVGSDAAVRSISRGDSRFVELGGARVVPAVAGDVLEPGSRADFVVLAADRSRIAVLLAGRVVQGALPAGTAAAEHHAP